MSSSAWERAARLISSPRTLAARCVRSCMKQAMNASGGRTPATCFKPKLKRRGRRFYMPVTAQISHGLVRMLGPFTQQLKDVMNKLDEFISVLWR